jgi:hypothetical protein
MLTEHYALYSRLNDLSRTSDARAKCYVYGTPLEVLLGKGNCVALGVDNRRLCLSGRIFTIIARPLGRTIIPGAYYPVILVYYYGSYLSPVAMGEGAYGRCKVKE